jgi:GWxTD domain-containing protein
MTGRKLEFEGELDQAESVYKRQIAVNPQHGRAEFDLARVWYKLEKRELMGSRPELFHDCVLPLLEAYQVTDGMAGAQNLISEVLRSVGDTTRALLEDIQWVASPDETKAYAATPDERKEVYVRAFWQRRDPAPATPGNERLVEHYRRVLYAMRQFGEYQQPWDRRGDIYIRYGEPTHKSSRGNVRFETDPGVVNVRERLWQSLHLEARKEIIARANRLQATTRHIRINDRGGSSIDISDFEDGEFELDPKRAFRRASSLRDNFVYRSGVRLNTRDPGVDTENWRGYPTFPIDGAVRWEYWVYPNVAGGIEIDFVALSSGAPFDYPEIPQDWELSNYNVGTWNQRRPSLIVAKAVSRQPSA